MLFQDASLDEKEGLDTLPHGAAGWPTYPAYWATSGTKRSQRMNRVARKGP